MSFWATSLAIYRQPGVSEACLALQDQSGADVNAILFAFWAACEGHTLGVVDFERLEAATREWRSQVVQPLRVVRRALKVLGVTTEALRLRDSVKAAELEAERQQQGIMESLLAAGTGDAATSVVDRARINLAAYAAVAGLDLPGPAVVVLIDAIRTCRASRG